MENNNIILVKGLRFDELKNLLDDSFGYLSLDILIYHTGNARHNVICLPKNRKPYEFIYDFADMMESDKAKSAVFYGWFIADDNILRATPGACYMMTNVVDSEGNKLPLIVDENNKYYINYDYDSTDEGDVLYENEDKAYIDEKGTDNCTCLHRTNTHKAKYIPCKLPKLTTSENYRPHDSSENDNTDSIITWFIDKCDFDRMDRFMKKHFGIIGLSISKILRCALYILLPMFPFGILMEGIYDFSDTIMDYNCSFFDIIFFGVCAGIVVTVIRRKGIQFTVAYFKALAMNIVLVYLVTDILFFCIFATNKVVGKAEYKEMRAKIVRCEEVSGNHSYNEVIFTIPISTAVYRRQVDIKDKSFFNCDSCTVVYHNGFLGMDVIDKIKH